MSRITIDFIDTNNFNPFNAAPEELIAFLLDENALLLDKSMINGIPAKEYCRTFYQKRTLFRENYKNIN